MKCQYCQNEAEWVENKEVYGKNYGKSYMIWLCRKCDAFVGCHNNTKEPLGTLADKELRELRKQAHEKFDELWKSGIFTRTEAYKKISQDFGYEVHIGNSNKEECQKIIDWC